MLFDPNTLNFRPKKPVAEAISHKNIELWAFLLITSTKYHFWFLAHQLVLRRLTPPKKKRLELRWSLKPYCFWSKHIELQNPKASSWKHLSQIKSNYRAFTIMTSAKDNFLWLAHQFALKWTLKGPCWTQLVINAHLLKIRLQSSNLPVNMNQGQSDSSPPTINNNQIHKFPTRSMFNSKYNLTPS